MTTSEEKRLQNRKHQANARKKPGYKEHHRKYVRSWKLCRKSWLGVALRTFARLQFERMERQGV